MSRDSRDPTPRPKPEQRRVTQVERATVEERVPRQTLSEDIQQLRKSLLESSGAISIERLVAPLGPINEPPPAPDDTRPFRPIVRPATLLMCVADDGKEDDGEWIRIRSSRFVIGRTEGDLTIPNDQAISSRHLEICCASDRGGQTWKLRDLDSSNGTFVRVAKVRLSTGSEILVGTTRLQLQEPVGAGAAADNSESGTRAWHAVSKDVQNKHTPCLVKIAADAEADRWPLLQQEHWIGRDASRCDILLSDDLMVSPVHARIYNRNGRWKAANHESCNGLWSRVRDMVFSESIQVQIGEQRLLFRVPT